MGFTVYVYIAHFLSIILFFFVVFAIFFFFIRNSEKNDLGCKIHSELIIPLFCCTFGVTASVAVVVVVVAEPMFRKPGILLAGVRVVDLSAWGRYIKSLFF